ncbi:MAG: hypothetical protein IJV06_00520, partial [Bacteroidaceae bacterium]|nr:hypothetical protein [Bacteroidaceae bacterium]
MRYANDFRFTSSQIVHFADWFYEILCWLVQIQVSIEEQYCSPKALGRSIASANGSDFLNSSIHPL